jgi:Bifunctional DNA primase/polymerase, N-terminal
MGLTDITSRRDNSKSSTWLWARGYAALNLQIFPVSPNKRPLCPHGLRDATNDLSIIAGWMQRWAHCDWGMALPASVVVADLDIKPGRNGFADFERLEGRSPHDVLTPRATTPSGGRHLYFQALKPYKNAVGILGTAIDVRSAGGYTILPDLPGPGGNGRVWEEPLSTPMLDAPGWLDCAVKHDRPQFNSTDPRPPGAAPPGDPKARALSLTTLAIACSKIVAARRGTRDNVRHMQCFYVGGLVGGGALDEATALHALLEAARAMVGADEFHDLEKRVRKSLEAGMAHPLFMRGTGP